MRRPPVVDRRYDVAMAAMRGQATLQEMLAMGREELVAFLSSLPDPARVRWEEDAKILYGRSVLVTGVPGPHALSRMAAIAREEVLIGQLSASDKVAPEDVRRRLR